MLQKPSATETAFFNLAKIAREVFVLIGVTILAATLAAAQTPNNGAAERERGFQLLQEGKFAEAQQVFEKLIAANPNDGQAQFGFGFALTATSKNIADETARRQARVRARNALLRAKQLGVQNGLLEAGIASIAPDGGGTVTFSSRADVDKAMQEGEAAFARGDYDKAIAAYQRALSLDPKLYTAAVFIGDMYFQKKQVDEAGRWYGRAITIDPDRETAYRYWSDVLLKSGRMEEALGKAIEAIIAEPYNRTSYAALNQWSQVTKISIGHPRIVSPNASTYTGGTTTLSIDPRTLNSADGSNEWLLYDLTRQAWRKTEFLKNYPGEKFYRHSLKEETTALRLVAEACAKDLQSGKIKVLEPQLDSLVQLNGLGLIEPYVLFAHPDDGIAKDYVEYRKASRDKLKRYWLEVAIIKG
jgi:tetratricopeptide (TPR) repeat protein